MTAIEHLAQLLADMEIQVVCDDLEDFAAGIACRKTCTKLQTPDVGCWLKWAASMEKADGSTPDIPVYYIMEKARKSTGAESTYLRKLASDWEKEHTKAEKEHDCYKC